MVEFIRQKVPKHKIPSAVKEKWGEEVLDEGFVPTPKRFIRCLANLFENEKSIDELAAIFAIADYKRPDLERLPSADYLAFLAGLPIDRFKSACERLQAKGFIEASGTNEHVDIGLNGLRNKIMHSTREIAWPAQ